MVTGIAQQGGTRVTDKRHGGALTHACDQALGLLPLIMFMKGKTRRGYAEMPQQPGAVPGIFSGDKRSGAQYLDRPRRHIPEIADRRSHYIKGAVYN
jgi:hypothetical protein